MNNNKNNTSVYKNDIITLYLNDIETLTIKGLPKGKLHTLLLVTDGSGVIQIDFDEHIAIKNKVFFIEKYKTWKWIKLDNINGIMVQFTDSFCNSIYTGNPKIKSDQSLVGDISPFFKIEQSDQHQWQNLFETIMKENNTHKQNSKEIICLLLKTIILMYRRNSHSRINFIVGDRKKQLLFELRKLVNNHFTEIRTPKDFASRLNVSPNYLNSICKQIYNKTVSEIIQERTILESKRLLIHTGLTISEISDKLGFKDNSYFGRYFKKAAGIPPEKYRLTNY